MTSYDQEIADLQARLSFQEDTLQALNTRVASQDREIQNLQAQLQHLYKQMRELKDGLDEVGSADDAPPPHY